MFLCWPRGLVQGPVSQGPVDLLAPVSQHIAPRCFVLGTVRDQIDPAESPAHLAQFVAWPSSRISYTCSKEFENVNTFKAKNRGSLAFIEVGEEPCWDFVETQQEGTTTAASAVVTTFSPYEGSARQRNTS